MYLFQIFASRQLEKKKTNLSTLLVSYNRGSRECALAFIAALFSPPDFLLSEGLSAVYFRN